MNDVVAVVVVDDESNILKKMSYCNCCNDYIDDVVAVVVGNYCCYYYGVVDDIWVGMSNWAGVATCPVKGVKTEILEPSASILALCSPPSH